MDRKEFINHLKGLSEAEKEVARRERKTLQMRKYARPTYQKRGKHDRQWAFLYFAKKGLMCVFPHIFNGKKVKKFNQVGRPIGENDIDLIEDYYYNISKNPTLS